MMSQDDIREAENTEVEQTTQVESPTTNETNDSSEVTNEGNADDVSTSTEAQEEAVAEPQEEQSESRRDRSAEGRIKELIAKNKNLTAQQQRQFSQSTPAQQRQFTDYLEGKQDVTPSELNEIANRYLADVQGSVLQQADSLVNLRLQQREARQTLENDLNQVAELELIKENPEVEKKVLNAWQRAANAQFDQDGNLISFNPNVRLADIAKEEVEVLEKFATKSRANDKAVLSQQAEESAVTPNTKSSPDKPFSELSTSEMEKRLGIVEP